jgi:SAM-dependent methyltransferase
VSPRLPAGLARSGSAGPRSSAKLSAELARSGSAGPRSSAKLSAELIVDLVDAGSREHYADAALYDYEYRRRRADVAFYRDLAKQRLKPGDRILELGAGSGRVTVQLARAGFQVVALDASKPMLAKLRARVAALPQAVAKRITVVEGDLRSFELTGKFPLAIAVFNVLEHLYTRVEVDACMRSVARHLSPGGAFAFDVQLPDLAWLLRDPTKRWARTRFTDPTTGRAMFYSTNHDYDPIGQIALIRLYYEPVDGKGPTKIVKLSQRKFFPAELEALVAHAGLRMVDRYGDFAWRPLEESAESQVLVCEHAIRRGKTPQPRRD